MRYSDIVKINNDFQYSVNLQYDLDNINKVKDYILTKDGCDLLKFYCNSIINKKNRATILVGPYGKGKSHLILTFLNLICNYNKEDNAIINKFVKNSKNIDEELYDLLTEIRNQKQSFLPVIINSNYSDVNQAFLIGISEALERANLKDIVINTYFDIALKVLEKWESERSIAIDEIKTCLKEYSCSLKELKNGLSSYDERYYDIFRNVYSCVLHGQEFIPLVNSDIIKTFKDITHELTKYGYKGIFVAFDEFSKFLECTENTHISKDLKIIQDLAELANRTGTSEQIHFCCITHKSFAQYITGLDDDKVNAFKTVEGRFKEVFFNRSIEQNFEIISQAIEKLEGFEKYYKEYVKHNNAFYNELNKNSSFKNIDNVEKILFEGCFPINPYAAIILIAICEKVAQNERTLFTFLTDDDEASLNSFISKKDSIGNLLGVDNIYEYFKNIIKKDSSDKIREIWLKSENALYKAKTNDEARIIKTIAIIYIIGENDLIIPNDNTIKCSLNMNDKQYEDAINGLIEKSIIVRKKITEEIDFATIYSRGLYNEIKSLASIKFDDIDIRKSIDELIPIKYILPRRYNETFKLTRFFANIFLSEEEFLNINKFNVIEQKYYCDGIVINLVRESKNLTKIREHFMEISSESAILKIPKYVFPKQLASLIKEYNAINYLISNLDKNEDEVKELELLKNEYMANISEQIEDYYSIENLSEYLYKDKKFKSDMNLSYLVSDICNNLYSKTPIINNEMINKKELSSPIKKARDIVIDSVINDDISMIKSKTSAEATIYNAVVGKKETDSINGVMKLIKKFITNSENNKISFKQIYNKLDNPPYSVRKGVIPILFAIAFQNYSDIIVVYYSNQEIELNSNTLVKINDNPDNYYLKTEKGTQAKLSYLDGLSKVFGVDKAKNYRIQMKLIVDSMKRWILSMPRIIREYEISNSTYSINDSYISFKKEILRPDINYNELIFEKTKEIFGTDDYKEILEQLVDMKRTFEKFTSEYMHMLVSKVKELLDKDYKGSLSTLLKEIYKKYSLDNSYIVYEYMIKEIVNYIGKLKTFDEIEIIDELAKIITGLYVEDWQQNDYQKFVNGIEQFVETIKKSDDTQYKMITSNVNILSIITGNEKYEKYISPFEGISRIGCTLSNNIEEIINEYGESVSEQEKISVLANIIKKYI